MESSPPRKETWAFAGARCPFDAVEFQPTDAVVLCPECETPHHAECWETNGACTQYGCQARGLAALPPAIRQDSGPLVILSAEEKRVPCPYCAEPILSIARKCKHCGEYLDARLRRERSRFPVPARTELPPGARFVGVSEAATGILFTFVGLVTLMGNPDFGSGEGAFLAFGIGNLVLGSALSLGREWARRLNEAIVGGLTFFFGLYGLVGAVVGGLAGAGVFALVWTTAGWLLLRSLRSRQCREFCSRRQVAP